MPFRVEGCTRKQRKRHGDVQSDNRERGFLGFGGLCVGYGTYVRDFIRIVFDAIREILFKLFHRSRQNVLLEFRIVNGMGILGGIGIMY